MIGLGLGILWLGYTAFAVGRVYAKGTPVKFSDMVLPKNRANGVVAVKTSSAGIAPGGTVQLGPGSTQYLAQPGTQVGQ